MKGQKFLKVTGILMIIGGAIGIIAGIIALVAALVLAASGYPMMAVSCVLVLIAGIIELIAGIIGVKNCKKPEKATKCMVWGVIVAVITVVSVILSIAGANEAGTEVNASSITSNLVTGLILPALFIVGAALNKKSVPAEQAE